MVDVNENPRAQNEPLRDTPQDHIARGGCIDQRKLAQSLHRTFLEISDQISGIVHRSNESAYGLFTDASKRIGFETASDSMKKATVSEK